MIKKSAILNPNYKTCGDHSVEAGRGTSGQIGWYVLASKFCKNQSVLDVGCGLGKGLEILSKVSKKAYGIEIDERLKKPNVEIKDISQVPTKSVDTVLAIDVIEHIEDDIRFIEHLMRVAHYQILISTPNYTAGRCKWPYHVREYMPHELFKIFSKYINKDKIQIYKGTPRGDKYFLVKHRNIYFIFNKLRVFWLTSFITRCINYVLPLRAKIHSHLFFRILLD